MTHNNRLFYFFFVIIVIHSCTSNNVQSENAVVYNPDSVITAPEPVIVGAEQFDVYKKLIENKKVGLVVNQSSIVQGKHLLDFLLEKKIQVMKIFAAEHGIRGNLDRGKNVKNGIDEKTGLPIVSMFGKNRRPTDKQLENIDVMMFDLQDVGARFFTYISSMNEVMEACAKNNIKLIVLDRPNPLGDYIDGPVRKAGFKSFVSMHPIPIVHGLTVGELALMINGEKWLTNGKTCNLEVIKMKNYTHTTRYPLPIKPSPNLPNYLSVRLYPSLCFFEATTVSVGRGTKFPFQVIGYPNPSFGDSLFIPRDIKGMQINPVQEGKLCYGVDLRKLNPDSVKFTIKYFIDFYNKFKDKRAFINRTGWFNILAGNDVLLKQIKSGMSEKEIKASWQEELAAYKKMRQKYLLYKSFIQTKNQLK